MYIVYICIYIYICIYTNVYVCMYVCICVYTFTYIYIYIYILNMSITLDMRGDRGSPTRTTCRMSLYFTDTGNNNMIHLLEN